MADETLEASPGASAASKELVPGATLGKYRLVRILGAGGMGVVWAAHDPDLERDVALKVLRYDNPAPELRARLLREARAMAKLKHPNVLTVYEVDSEKDRDFIAMELVDGASLDAWLATKPPRDAVWDAILGAGRGLAAAHRAGLVHRDFKPHNVLRSDDGRILVTDFGLARGQAEENAFIESTLPAIASGLEATMEVKPAKTSSTAPTGSFGGPLTQTGVLLGTPAYMAPEQFLGAVSGPRTDQFAYCVTAWQLFAGERPFRGDTLEELRKAASSGVGNAKASLPGAIRAVLARGLDPDPAKRWPDMNELLTALERAKQQPKRYMRIGGAVIAVGLASVLAVKIFRQPPTPPATPGASSMCALTPEAEMAKAWSSEMRDGMVKKWADHPGAKYVAAEMDAFAARWIADYRSACESPRSTKTFAKLGCLLGERDQIEGLTAQFPAVPGNALEEVEMGGILPRIQACNSDSPVTPPTMPDDPQRRTRIQALRPKLMAARFAPDAFAMMPSLLEEAKAIAWDPIIAETHEVFGVAARRAGHRWADVRDHYKKANELARRTHHYHLEASTWVELLHAELDAASDPNDTKHFQDLIAQARIAVRNAGDDPVFSAHITHIEGNFEESRGNYDDAIAKYIQSRIESLSARDFASAVKSVVEEAQARGMRSRPDDLDAAWAALTEVERIATEHFLSKRKLQDLRRSLAYVARMRGDHAAAHSWADREGKPKPPKDAIAITGRVVDAEGKPAAGATVVAWRGFLQGDSTRVYEGPYFDGDIATTDAGGNFTVKGLRGGGIIAELGDRRSPPVLVGDSVTLTLGTTRTITGKVLSDDEVLTGIVIGARYDLAPQVAWYAATHAGRGPEFEIAGLPSGEPSLWLYNALDPNAPDRKLDAGPARDGATPRWPSGPTLDVIVRNGAETRPQIFVFRGKVAAKTREDLFRLVPTVKDVNMHPALVVGFGDQTAEAVGKYKPGDGHARMQSNAPGTVTVCVTDPVQCKVIEIPARPGELRNGRRVFPAIPIIFER